MIVIVIVIKMQNWEETIKAQVLERLNVQTKYGCGRNVLESEIVHRKVAMMESGAANSHMNQILPMRKKT